MPRGKAVIGQSGGPTAVINRSLVGFIKEAIKSDFDDILGAKHGLEVVVCPGRCFRCPGRIEAVQIKQERPEQKRTESHERRLTRAKRQKWTGRPREERLHSESHINEEWSRINRPKEDQR